MLMLGKQDRVREIISSYIYSEIAKTTPSGIISLFSIAYHHMYMKTPVATDFYKHILFIFVTH